MFFKNSDYIDMDEKKNYEMRQALQTTVAAPNQKPLCISVFFVPQTFQGLGVYTNSSDKTRKRGIYIFIMFACMHMSEQKGGMETYLKHCSVTNNLVLLSKL